MTPELAPPENTPLDPTSLPEAAFQAFQALTRNRRRGGNPHPPMLQNRYVSGSNTVKLTCAALADRIAGKTPDDSDPHWGENGNALADINLVNVPYGENTASVRILGTAHDDGKDWTFEIHADGIALTDAHGCIMHPELGMPMPFVPAALVHKSSKDWWFNVEEHKAPLFPYDDDAWDIARRQALAFTGAVLRMHESGIRHLEPANYLEDGDPRRIPLPLPETLHAGSINLICAPYSAEREERSERVTRQQAFAELDRLLGKARAAIRTATGRDPDAAARWDREHPEEFLWRSTQVIPANRDAATAEVARLCRLHRCLTPPEDTTKAIREKARDRIKALIQKHGLPKEAAFDNGAGYKINAKGNFSSIGDQASIPKPTPADLAELGSPAGA